MKHSNLAVFLPHLGCKHRCSFCSQHHISATAAPPTPAQVAAQLAEAAESLSEPSEQCEVAYFGGSFTALPVEDQEAYLAVASQTVHRYGLLGIRLSTRPDAVDEEVLARLARYGVTAVELGAQSMCDEVLQANRRGHSAEEVRRAARLIQAAGMSLGLQMMTGLYQDTPERSLQTAKDCAALRPDTMRIYPTVVLPDTDLAQWYQAGVYHPPGVEETLPLCAALLDYFEEQSIRVIRLGLHAEELLEKQHLAGCYHPALRECCESVRYLKRAEHLLNGGAPSKATLLVASGETSKMVGQHRKNILFLEQQYGVRLRVRELDSLSKGRVLLDASTRAD